MENRYPLFAGGRILKKESLWDLRDYAYESLKLQYADYTDGILKGCRVHVEGQELVIGRGMLKYGDFICLMQEEAHVAYQGANKLNILKAVFEKQNEHPDYLTYRVSFLLDEDAVLSQGQIEFCRFHLREGSLLRDTYKDFTDMSTEYDTINLLHATIAGRRENRMHPQVLLKFAKEMQKHDKKNIENVAFCYHILQHSGEVEQEVVDAYLDVEQTEDNFRETRAQRCFAMLENILKSQVNNQGVIQKRNVIFVE